MGIETIYDHLFTTNKDFQRTYIQGRDKLYNHLLKIIKQLHANSVLDIGCAYGILCELCNYQNISTWGIDLPIENLKYFHEQLNYSYGHFIYGSVNNKEFVCNICEKYCFDVVLMLDTLRYLEHPDYLLKINPKYLIIKEVCNNSYIREKRKNQFDFKLYKPLDLCKVFTAYSLIRIYPSRYIFSFNNPHNKQLSLINYVFPSYTAVLKKDCVI